MPSSLHGNQDFQRYQRYVEAVFAPHAGRRLATITDRDTPTGFRHGDSLLKNLGWTPRI